jgi:hypothetical protein
MSLHFGSVVDTIMLGEPVWVRWKK